MPIYEYECIPNKHRFEIIQKFSDPAVTHCTVCGEPVQRLLSAPAIQFKGSGWYITDYARKSSAPSSESPKEKSSSSKETSTSSTASDTSSKSEGSSTPTTATKSESKE
jgi:putative FmdB family regulatory protein